MELLNQIHEIHSKIKHISVFQSEVAKMLLPSKGGKFKTSDELKSSIKSRETVINHGILMSKWINCTAGSSAIGEEEQTYRSTKSKTAGENKRIKHFKFHDGFSREVLSNRVMTPGEGIGRNKALLSGTSTKMRDTTFKVLSHEFKEKKRAMIKSVGRMR